MCFTPFSLLLWPLEPLRPLLSKHHLKKARNAISGKWYFTIAINSILLLSNILEPTQTKLFIKGYCHLVNCSLNCLISNFSLFQLKNILQTIFVIVWHKKKKKGFKLCSTFWSSSTFRFGWSLRSATSSFDWSLPTLCGFWFFSCHFFNFQIFSKKEIFCCCWWCQASEASEGKRLVAGCV